MISFIQFIKESKDEFKYIKLPMQRARDVKFYIPFQGKEKIITANINYECIYKIPIWQGDVDFNRQKEIKLHDVDIVELSNIHERIWNKENQMDAVYAPFKTGTTPKEAEYLKSLFVHYFIEGIKEGSIVQKSKFSVAQDAQKQLQRNKGNDIL